MPPERPPSSDAELLEVLGELEPDARRVLLVLARRLLAGQKHYGRLDVANDARDFRHEAAEEAADLAIYSAMELVAQDVRRRRTLPASLVPDVDEDEPSRGDVVIADYVERAIG